MRVSGANRAVWRTGWRSDEGLVSKSGGLAHGRGLDEGLGSKSGGLAHGSGAVETLVSKQGGLAHGSGAVEALVSKQGGLAHGRRLFERYGLHYMLLGVWQAKNVSAEK